jgi:uncharacterized protein YqeY
MILKPELNCKNKIIATGVLTVPVLRYIFGVIDCRFEERQKIDKKTGNMQIMSRMGYQKGDSLHVNGKQGEKGLLQTEATYQAEIINIAKYLNTKYKEGEILSRVKSHERSQPNTNSTSTIAAKLYKN